MKILVDTNVLLDFLDGVIENPFLVIPPYKILVISPVVLHEVLRTFSADTHNHLIDKLGQDLLAPPSPEQWTEAAKIMRELYPLRLEKNIAKMHNDVLIALTARHHKLPVWSRDADFEFICDFMGIGLVNK